MKKRTEVVKSDLDILCETIKELVLERNYKTCLNLISEAMQQYPHAPHPHNLMGLVLENMGDHVGAMRHFRAAWALDPTYLPSSHNLHVYGTFFSNGKCAYCESDI